MRQIFILLLTVSAFMAVALGISFWVASSDKEEIASQDPKEEIRDLAKVEELLSLKDRSRAIEALLIISNYQDSLLYGAKDGSRWIDVFLSACVQAENYKLLVEYYEFLPQVFEKREDAALLVASAYVALRRLENYQKLRSFWDSKTSSPDQWFLLDAGKLVAEGKRDEAEELLKSKTLKDDAETGRLIRLAMFHVGESPKESWDYLTQAQTRDPTDSTIRSLRAKFLESFGKMELARAEYITAIAQDPEDPSLRDQLAEFYRKNGKYNLALGTWSETLKKTSSDTIWAKAWFWSRMVRPIDFDWSAASCPEGWLKPLVEYLIQLKPDVYWDDRMFEGHGISKKFLHSEQLTFWLRLMQHLKDNNEEKALELLEANTFTVQSWDPDLELALKRILYHRRTGKFAFPTVKAGSERKHALFRTLDMLASPELSEGEFSTPPGFQHLIGSEEAFTVAFAAAGWSEAALQLHRLPIIPNTFPGWAAYGIAQAMRNNRDSLETLNFITKQKPSSPLQLLMGEVLITSGDTEAALEQLATLSNEDSIIGYRASWLLSLLYVERKEFEQARKMVDANPRLSGSVLGQETLARVALLEGDYERADRIYTTLENQSSEAMSYLARKAFTQKNWKKARELTERLLRKHPSNIILRKNLSLIIEQQTHHEE